MDRLPHVCKWFRLHNKPVPLYLNTNSPHNNNKTSSAACYIPAPTFGVCRSITIIKRIFSFFYFPSWFMNLVNPSPSCTLWRSSLSTKVDDWNNPFSICSSPSLSCFNGATERREKKGGGHRQHYFRKEITNDSKRSCQMIHRNRRTVREREKKSCVSTRPLTNCVTLSCKRGHFMYSDRESWCD